MNELKLNKDHDLVYDEKSKRILRITKASSKFSESVLQAVLCMLKTEDGEAFADIEEGVPWFGRILGLEVSNLDVATRIIRDKISKVRGVSDVVSLKLVVNGRNIGSGFTIRCTDGDTAEGEF